MNLYMVYPRMLSSLTFWIVTIVIAVACLIPDYSMHAFRVIKGDYFKFYPGGNRRKTTNIAPQVFPQVTEL